MGRKLLALYYSATLPPKSATGIDAVSSQACYYYVPLRVMTEQPSFGKRADICSFRGPENVIGPSGVSLISPKSA